MSLVFPNMQKALQFQSKQVTKIIQNFTSFEKKFLVLSPSHSSRPNLFNFSPQFYCAFPPGFEGDYVKVKWLDTLWENQLSFIKGTSHDSIFLFSLFSTLADIFAV